MKSHFGLSNTLEERIQEKLSNLRISWNVNRFLREYEFWLRRYQTSMSILNNNIHLLSHLKHTIIYEELQMDFTKSLKELFSTIRKGQHQLSNNSYLQGSRETKFISKNRPHHHNMDLNGVTIHHHPLKRGREDLKRILSNYDLIEKHLRKHQCVCHIKMLTASVPMIIPKFCIRNASYNTCPYQ